MNTKRGPVLCYVRDHRAYFTTQALADQWGNRWAVAPYETETRLPYLPWSGEQPWDIFIVRYGGALKTPAEIAGHYTGYSVEDINHGAAAWLFDRESGIAIAAGTALSDFENLVKKAGGSARREGRLVLDGAGAIVCEARSDDPA